MPAPQRREAANLKKIAGALCSTPEANRAASGVQRLCRKPLETVSDSFALALVSRSHHVGQLRACDSQPLTPCRTASRSRQSAAHTNTAQLRTKACQSIPKPVSPAPRERRFPNAQLCSENPKPAPAKILKYPVCAGFLSLYHIALIALPLGKSSLSTPRGSPCLPVCRSA